MAHSKLQRVCLALTAVPLLLGAALMIGGFAALSIIVWSEIVGSPALESTVRFLGAAFMALGIILARAVREPHGHGPIIAIAGLGLVLGAAARALSLAVDGSPGPVTIALGGAEFSAGLAYLCLARRHLRPDGGE